MSCHVRQAEEWRGSLHHRADTDPAYRRAFAVEPSAFCRGCHAPESDPVREPPRAVSELGVGCVTCHVTEEGLVLAAPEREEGGSTGARSPHPLRRSTSFAREGGCAGCHEFRFPAAPRRAEEDGDFMQTTAREHARSRAAGRACADCHMPEVGGHRSHSFAEVRDPAWLRGHLTVNVEVDGDVARVTLTQTDPGHAYPTGDLFRRLRVGCELRAAGGEVLRRDARYLDRRFELVPGKAGRTLRSDTRVFGEPVVLELDATPPPGTEPATLRCQVTYQRVATVGLGTKPEEATIESEVELYSGILPLPGRR